MDFAKLIWVLELHFALRIQTFSHSFNTKQTFYKDMSLTGLPSFYNDNAVCCLSVSVCVCFAAEAFMQMCCAVLHFLQDLLFWLLLHSSTLDLLRFVSLFQCRKKRILSKTFRFRRTDLCRRLGRQTDKCCLFNISLPHILDFCFLVFFFFGVATLCMRQQVKVNGMTKFSVYLHLVFYFDFLENFSTHLLFVKNVARTSRKVCNFIIWALHGSCRDVFSCLLNWLREIVALK